LDKVADAILDRPRATPADLGVAPAGRLHGDDDDDGEGAIRRLRLGEEADRAGGGTGRLGVEPGTSGVEWLERLEWLEWLAASSLGGGGVE
jgi:hypothetical protein